MRTILGQSDHCPVNEEQGSVRSIFIVGKHSVTFREWRLLKMHSFIIWIANL